MEREQIKSFIAKRVAKELRDGDVVNLGIGLPTLVASYVPKHVNFIVHSDAGIIGVGKLTEDNIDPAYKVDAGGMPAVAAPGGCYVDSCMSFGLGRGGHIDTSVLGALQVDQEGNLSSWIIPGKLLPGIGGAMDLVVGSKKVIIAMEHTNHGRPKILIKNTLPFTALNCVDLIVTEMGVMELTPDGILLTEYNPAFSPKQIQAATEAELLISPALKPMV